MTPRSLLALLALTICLGGALATPASADEAFSLPQWVSQGFLPP